MNHKKQLVILFVVLSFFAVNAKVVAKYSIDATGMTNEYAVGVRFSIPDSEEFESLEDLKEQAESFRQKMVNSRIFIDVKLSYEEESENSYKVLFNLESAKTFIALPYPKYDSNDGFSLKLKVKDTNFLGSMGNLGVTVDMTQQTEGDDNKALDFTSSSFDVAFSLDDIIVGNTVVNTVIDATIDLSEKNWAKNSDLEGSVSIDEIPLGKAKFASSLEFSGNFAGLRGSDLGFITKFTDIALGDDVKFYFNPYIYSAITEEGKAAFQKAGTTTGVTYNKFGFDASFFDYFLDDSSRTIKTPYFGASFSASYQVLDWLKPSVTISMNRKANTDFLKDICLSESVSFSYKGFDFSVGESNSVDFEDESTTVSLSGSASTSGGQIDYVLDDFREGFEYEASVSGIVSPTHKFSDRTTAEYNYLRARGSFTWFPIALEYFNPSIRVNIVASERPLGLYKPTSLSDPENGYGFDFTDTSSVVYLGEFMRGVRNTDSKSLSVHDSHVAVVANFDLKLKADSTVDFMDLYFTPFLDAALIVDFKNKKTQLFESFGFDATAVLASYPSYPIRVSFALDMKKIRQKFAKEETSGGLFELFIGLHHFY